MRPGPRSQRAKHGLWSPARTGQCHLPAMGSARVRVRQVATWGRRPNAPGESAGGLDLAGRALPSRGAKEKLGMRGWLRAVLLAAMLMVGSWALLVLLACRLPPG